MASHWRMIFDDAKFNNYPHPLWFLFMTIDIILWFPWSNSQSIIFGHVSKIVSLVALYFIT
jgi:hypothetical protein